MFFPSYWCSESLAFPQFATICARVSGSLLPGIRIRQKGGGTKEWLVVNGEG